MTNRRDRDVANDKLQTILADMLKDEDNKYCADCDAKGPRWASWNLGIFLCIRCAGIHRNLGVHISRVKSVNLDTWTPEQIAMMQEIGNSRGRAIYEANLPDNFRRPQNDMAVEQLIRSKYEEKRYIAKEWVPPKPHNLTLSTGDDKRRGDSAPKRRPGAKPVVDLTRPPNSSALPRPNGQSRTPTSAARKAPEPKTAEPPPPPKSSHTADLLGLEDDEPRKNPEGNGAPSDDLFGEFLSKPPVASTSADNLFAPSSSLEKNMFEQPVSTDSPTDKAEPPKSTKESILALYGSQPSLATLPAAAAAPNQFLAMPPSQVPIRGCPSQGLAVCSSDGPVYGMMHASASAPHMGSLGFTAGVNGSPSGLVGYPAGPPTSGAMWGQSSIQGHQQKFSAQQQGFPAQQQGFPAQQQGFPGQQQGFPAQQQGFQPQQQCFPAQQQQPHSQGSFFASNNASGGSPGQASMFGVQHNPFFAQRQAQMQQQQQQQQQMYLQQVQQQLSGLQIAPSSPAAATVAPPPAGQTLATDLWQ